ncbi:MAG: aminotransferase [Robiginitomaculum sp.]|nr:MAG: aminotransferase [Robiginitomaculum sp.]
MNIPQMEPWLGDEEADAVSEYMRSGGWLMEFGKSREFEAAIAKLTGAKHCIVTNNGTISLTLGAIACGVKAGDEVIIPNFTMIASPNSMKMFGAVPVFVDVEVDTLCLDLEKTKAAITPKTKAIMLVTANGRAPTTGIEAFQALADEHNIVLIEDSAQSLGSYYPDGSHIGTKGLVGSFSFSVPKIITTGQGGALITNDDHVASQIRKLKDFGRSGGGNDVHDMIGWNFKFTDMQACVGIEQMKKLDYRIGRKKEIWKAYAKGLQGLNSLKLFDHDLKLTSPWFIDSMCENREALQAHLKNDGIGSRVMYPPINTQLAYKIPGEYPVSELVGQKGLWLPSASQLTDEQIATICASIQTFYA